MKRKKTLLLLSLLAVASGASAWAADNEGVAANRPPIVSAPADAEYSGTVVDKQTGETLIGVTIGLWKGDDIIGGSTTDIDGHFTLVISDPGCTVRISYTGYKMLTFQPKDLKYRTNEQIRAIHEQCRKMHANYLLNFGPDPLGRMPAKAIEILEGLKG